MCNLMTRPNRLCQRGSSIRVRVRPFMPAACLMDRPDFSPLADSWQRPNFDDFREVSPVESDI